MVDRSPHHLPDQAILVRISRSLGRNMVTISKHRDRVAQTKNLLHTMGDINHGETATLEVSQQSEESLALHRRERTGRFVKNQNSGPGTDGGGNLEELLLAGGQFANEPVDLFIEAHFRKQTTGGVAHGLPIHHPPSMRPTPQTQVLGDGKFRAKCQFLVNHGDTQRPRLTGIPGRDANAPQANLTPIRHIDAGQNFSQGALARTILTHESVTAALGHGKRHLRQSLNPWIRLGDRVERQERHGGVRRRNYLRGSLVVRADCRSPVNSHRLAMWRVR